MFLWWDILCLCQYLLIYLFVHWYLYPTPFFTLCLYWSSTYIFLFSRAWNLITWIKRSLYALLLTRQLLAPWSSLAVLLISCQPLGSLWKLISLRSHAQPLALRWLLQYTLQWRVSALWRISVNYPALLSVFSELLWT